ncbi:MAG TPA: phage scaffolding protein [Tissierellaceae bacterium]
MNREFLRSLGLDDSAIDKIMAEHGKTVNELREENLNLNTQVEELKALEKQIEDRDNQLSELKEKAQGNDELTKQLDELQAQNESLKAKYEEEKKEIQLNSAIKLALKGLVHDTDITSNLITKDNLALTDSGQVAGLDEQISKLKEEKSFLFIQDNDNNSNDKGGFIKLGNDNSGDTNIVDQQIAEVFGNTEE